MEARVSIESCHVDGVLHQREYVRCGKARCKCNMGALHGPYWYSYHWVKPKGKRAKRKRGRRSPVQLEGRWISRYVGKELGAERD